MLGRRELVRYERQMMMPQWGKAGQEKLKRAKVLVAGAGGLGSAILTYLAIAGVGKIKVIDGDTVELANLNRQMLYTDKDIGRKKVVCAKERLESLNPDIKVEAVEAVLSEENAFDLVGDYPIVDGLDNLATRHLLNRVAVRRGLPLFHGAVYGFEGRATTIIPGKTSCLRCLYQDALPGKNPVVGVAPAIIGCIQATEVIKYVLDIGDLLADRLLIYDGLNLKFSEVRLKRDPNCNECQSRYPTGGER
jgi:molybdopterin/thiamine biosynthesis adenylyltransferase